MPLLLMWVKTVDIQKIFDKIPMPKEYYYNGNRMYYDSYRKMLLPATPEEKVRQKTAVYLEKYLNVPHNCLGTEVHLHHYEGITENGRIDITIDTFDENSLRTTIAVVECKAENIPLTDQVIEQAFGYADTILCDYVIVTNGIELLQFKYDIDKESYIMNADIANYEMMLRHFGKPCDITYTFERRSIKELFDVNYIKQYGIDNGYITADTPEMIIPYIANIYDALIDTSHNIPHSKNKFFEIIEDLGLSFLGYGDASGDTFGTGIYRSFLINDYKKGHRIINLGIMATGKSVNDPRYGTRNALSVLVVSVRDGENDEMAVQINLNKFLIAKEKTFYLTHNGAVSRKGARATEVKRRTHEVNNDMIKNDSIFLGECRGDRLLYVDTPEFSEMLNNTILYALIRDEYKTELSEKRRMHS